MIQFVAASILILCLNSCGNYSEKKYHISDFKTAVNEKYLSLSCCGCSDEKEAIQFAGAYLATAFRERSFPTDQKKWGNLTRIVPLCIQVQDIDSTFFFSNYIPGGFHEVPCQIDVNFQSGKKFRFCFPDIVFDPIKIQCEYCSENPKDLFNKYSNECK